MSFDHTIEHCNLNSIYLKHTNRWFTQLTKSSGLKLEKTDRRDYADNDNRQRRVLDMSLFHWTSEACIGGTKYPISPEGKYPL